MMHALAQMCHLPRPARLAGVLALMVAVTGCSAERFGDNTSTASVASRRPASFAPSDGGPPGSPVDYGSPRPAPQGYAPTPYVAAPYGSQSSYGPSGSGAPGNATPAYGATPYGNAGYDPRANASYGGQSSGYSAQSPGYGGQSPGYGGQSSGYSAQSPGYGGQSPGYGSPGYGASGYSSGSPGYGSPSYGAPGYGSPGYGSPGYAPTTYTPQPGSSRIDSQSLSAPVGVGAPANAYPSAPAAADVTGSFRSANAQSSRRLWNGDGGIAVTVKPGDTIESLSHRFGVSASAIMQANAISAGASIQPGQRLIVPRYGNIASASSGGAAPRPASLTRVASNAPIVPLASSTAGPSRSPPAATMTGGIHVVAPNETLSALGRLYGKSPAEIARANNLSPDVRIKVGQRLVIPGSSPPARAAARARILKPPTVSRTTEDTPAARPHVVQPAARPTPPAPKLVSADPAVNARVAAPTLDPPSEASGSPKEASEPTSSFRWPVRGRVISGFGPKTGGPANDGINLAVPEGTSIKAAEDGVVAYAGNELKGYGNLVLVRHGNGFVTAYAHASELMVKRGDQVKRGQIIARSGQTGTVSSPQLHFEIRKGSTPVDPMQYLSGT